MLRTVLMNIYWNNYYSNFTNSFFKKKILSPLEVNQRQRVCIIALISLSIFVIGYVLCRCYFFKANKVSQIAKNNPHEVGSRHQNKLEKEKDFFKANKATQIAKNNPHEVDSCQQSKLEKEKVKGTETLDNDSNKKSDQQENAKLDVKQLKLFDEVLVNLKSRAKRPNDVLPPSQTLQNNVDSPQGREKISEMLSLTEQKMIAYLQLKEKEGEKAFQQFRELMGEIYLMGRKLHDIVNTTDLKENSQVQMLLKSHPEDLMRIYRSIVLTYPSLNGQTERLFHKAVEIQKQRLTQLNRHAKTLNFLISQYRKIAKTIHDVENEIYHSSGIGKQTVTKTIALETQFDTLNVSLNEIAKKIENRGTFISEEMLWLQTLAEKEPEVRPLNTCVCNTHNGFLHIGIRSKVSNFLNELKELLDYKDKGSLRIDSATAAPLNKREKAQIAEKLKKMTTLINSNETKKAREILLSAHFDNLFPLEKLKTLTEGIFPHLAQRMRRIIFLIKETGLEDSLNMAITGLIITQSTSTTSLAPERKKETRITKGAKILTKIVETKEFEFEEEESESVKAIEEANKVKKIASENSEDKDKLKVRSDKSLRKKRSQRRRFQTLRRNQCKKTDSSLPDVRPAFNSLKPPPPPPVSSIKQAEKEHDSLTAADLTNKAGQLKKTPNNSHTKPSENDVSTVLFNRLSQMRSAFDGSYDVNEVDDTKEKENSDDEWKGDEEY